MNNPISLAYASALVAQKRSVPEFLKQRVGDAVESDFISLIQSNNLQLLKDLHYSKKISKTDSEIIVDWVVEFGSSAMMKLAIQLGYPVHSSSLARAVEIGDIKKTKFLFSYLNVRDLVDDDEIVSAFNVAVEENHKEVIKFLCRFELDTRFMSSEAQKRYEQGLF